MIGIVLGGPSREELQLTKKELLRLKKPIERAIVKAQLRFENEVKKTLTGKRSGRIYFSGRSRGGRRDSQGKFVKKGQANRGANGRFIRAGARQASAPGEPPALVTGSFRRSITHGPVEWEGEVASGPVGTNDVRARIFEYGGVTGRGRRTRILPRPYMAPTFLRVRGILVEILAEATQS